MNNILPKDEFVKVFKFISEQNSLQENLCKALEDMAPGFRCDACVYISYETQIISLLETMFNDTEEIIEYKLYEFDGFSDDVKVRQLKETPELETWETVYDYLIKNLNEGVNND